MLSLLDVLTNSTKTHYINSTNGYLIQMSTETVDNTPLVDIVDAGEGNTFKINTWTTIGSSTTVRDTDRFILETSDNGVDWTIGYDSEYYRTNTYTHNINLESRFFKLTINTDSPLDARGRIIFYYGADSTATIKDYVDVCHTS